MNMQLGAKIILAKTFLITGVSGG